MRSTVCLNMIVKNEARTIERCLNAALPFIDAWVIVDTGSTDGTQDLIRSKLGHLPGELHERPWKNFGHNRTEALCLAEGKADFLLLCDADMVLKINDPLWRPNPDYHGYFVRQQHNERSFSIIRLVNARLTGEQSWCYRGSTHEFIDSLTPDQNDNIGSTGAIEFFDFADGGSKSDKYTRDAALLEQELREIEAKEQNSGDVARVDHLQALKLEGRTVFYLAQTYRDMGELEKSLATYQRRAELGGWDEEVWNAKFEVAKLTERLQLGVEVITQRYLEAFNNRPRRAEPLVELARFHRQRKQYALAHLYARQAANMLVPNDILFIDTSAYLWRNFDEYAVACYWIGDYAECAKVCGQLLKTGVLPPDQVERVAENLTLARRKLRALTPSHEQSS
jgi:glycosyltransferase involved in cell wall biosynthesis